MPRALKFFGFLVINVVVALIGTAIVDSTIGKVFPAHSLVTVLWKEWILSIVCAVFIGFGMWRTWRSDAAKWTWVHPAVWFGISFFLAIGSGAVWCSVLRYWVRQRDSFSRMPELLRVHNTVYSQRFVLAGCLRFLTRSSCPQPG